MILVDTSVWVDHLHRPEPMLVDLLKRDEIASHPLVIEELALGSIARREVLLDSLGRLSRVTVASHGEVRELVEARRLWGRGLSAVDAHLLAAVLLSAGSVLWTRDKSLAGAAAEIPVPLVAWR